MRRATLTLTRLEDRATPATAVYAAGTLTVTIVAPGQTEPADNAFWIERNAEGVPGFLRVRRGLADVVFDSGADRPVRHLVVNPGITRYYGLNFGPDVSLASLTVRGGSKVTYVVLADDTRVAGNFTVTGLPHAGNESVTIPAGALIEGNVRLALGGGDNGVGLNGGQIGGNVRVTSGPGTDSVRLALDGPLTVGGHLTVRLGGGDNLLFGRWGNVVRVGGNFSYTGGLGGDEIDLTSVSGAPLQVLGSVSANLGGGGPPLNYWHTGDLAVGGRLSVRGAVDVQMSGPNFVGGDLALAGVPNEDNRVEIGYSPLPGVNTAASTVNGSLRYAGGNTPDTEDVLWLDHLTVGRNVNLRFGAAHRSLTYMGWTQDARVEVGGSLGISNTAADASAGGLYTLHRLTVGGRFSVRTFAGEDSVLLDNGVFLGDVLLDLGAADDLVQVDVNVADPAGALPGPTRFQAGLTIYGRAGNDSVYLGTAAPNTVVNVGGPVWLVGGAGVDHLELGVDNNYLVPPLAEGFET